MKVWWILECESCEAGLDNFHSSYATHKEAIEAIYALEALPAAYDYDYELVNISGRLL